MWLVCEMPCWGRGGGGGEVSSASDTLHVLLPSNAWSSPAVGPASLNLSFSSLSLKINCLMLVRHILVDFTLCTALGLAKPCSIHVPLFPKYAASISRTPALDLILAKLYFHTAWILTVIRFS